MCNSLAAWCGLTSELKMFVDYIIVFVDLHVRCQQQTKQIDLFCCQTAFLHFSEAACRFSQHVDGEDECFGNLKKSFGWKWTVNSTKLNLPGRMMSLLHRCLCSRRNSRKKTRAKTGRNMAKENCERKIFANRLVPKTYQN